MLVYLLSLWPEDNLDRYQKFLVWWKPLTTEERVIMSIRPPRSVQCLALRQFLVQTKPRSILVTHSGRVTEFHLTRRWWRIQVNIWNIYLNCAERYQDVIDHLSYTHNLSRRIFGRTKYRKSLASCVDEQATRIKNPPADFAGSEKFGIWFTLCSSGFCYYLVRGN